jgi:hypothetical protein
MVKHARLGKSKFNLDFEDRLDLTKWWWIRNNQDSAEWCQVNIKGWSHDNIKPIVINSQPTWFEVEFLYPIHDDESWVLRALRPELICKNTDTHHERF